MRASTFTIKQNFDFAHKPLDPGNIQANPICVIGVFIEVDVEPIGNDEQSVDFLVTGFVGEVSSRNPQVSMLVVLPSPQRDSGLDHLCGRPPKPFPMP